MLVVTHYQRLLNYVVPDFVHVMIEGRIVETGGKGPGRWNWNPRGTNGLKMK